MNIFCFVGLLLKIRYNNKCDTENLPRVFTLHSLFQFEVQIEDQGHAGAQVLQVASTSQQDLQGISTVQFVQQGELTEEQQQQVQGTV